LLEKIAASQALQFIKQLVVLRGKGRPWRFDGWHSFSGRRLCEPR
jgi:hypothetical protein